jgi:hypothetical protein
VIPVIDHIDEVLTTESIDHSFMPAIRAALAMGKKTLNRYYNLTDSSDVYRIAMGKSSYTILTLLNILSSVTSSAQVAILQTCEMGARVD